jgi:hypothetical protein
MNTRGASFGVFRSALFCAATILLAGCTYDSVGSLLSPQPATPAAKVSDAPPGAPRTAQPSPPPVAMAGRWTLAAMSGACGMNFGAEPTAGEGTIAPEGGCPDRFFTSRKWTYEQGALVIRDHQGQPLARLAMSSPMRFEGKATSGMQLSLSR